LAVAASVPFAFNIPSARADTSASNEVVVQCPGLAEAAAAELEARARATLLTSDLSATAVISCVGERVEVQVDTGADSVTLKLRVQTTTLREEVLRALDRALADLGARQTPDGQIAATAPAPKAVTAADALPLGGAAAEPLPTSPSSQPAPSVRNPASETAVGAHVIGESWGNRLALGGGLRADVRFDSTWACGIRAGALSPLKLGEATVVEAHVLFEAAVTARHLAGLRLSVSAGPSLLFASPASGYAATGATLRSAIRIEAQLGRPFRWHRVELTPWVGARAFTAERGVRVAEQSRLVVGGVAPQFGLALSVIH
jgi:hypothetical protein